MRMDNGMSVEMVEALVKLLPIVQYKGEFYYGVQNADGDDGFQWSVYVWEPPIHEWVEIDDINKVPEEVMTQFDPY